MFGGRSWRRPSSDRFRRKATLEPGTRTSQNSLQRSAGRPPRPAPPGRKRLGGLGAAEGGRRQMRELDRYPAIVMTGLRRHFDPVVCSRGSAALDGGNHRPVGIDRRIQGLGQLRVQPPRAPPSGCCSRDAGRRVLRAPRAHSRKSMIHGCTSPRWQACEPRAPFRMRDVEPMALCRSTADAVQEWQVRTLNRAVSLAGVKDHGQSAGR